MQTQFTSPPPPPPPPPDTPTHSQRWRLLAGTGIALITAAAVTGAILAFGFLRGSADSLVVMAPSDTALYVNIELDPSAGQKLAVAGLLDKFPGLRNQVRDETVNHWLDSTLSGIGLTHDDVRPWLGANISIVVLNSAVTSFGSTSSASAPAPVAVLIASRDDGRALAALDKYTRGPAGSRYTWSTATYDGTTVTSATGSGANFVYALANHTAVIGTSSSVVDEVIDTAQDKRANLASVKEYATVQSQLPTDRVASMYIDLGAVAKRLGSAVGGARSSQPGLNMLQAYTGFGMALVATSNGITLDGTEDFDARKLTPDMRTMLGISPHVNGTLAYVPKSAYGLFAFTGLQQTLRTALNTFGPNLGVSLNETLQRFGLTGSGGIMPHLTGDAGFEADPVAGQSIPAGAFIFGTDSSSAAQSFLEHLVTSLCGSSGSCDSTQITSQNHHGVIISSVPLSSMGAGVQPSWAVSDGWAIIGSNPEEVRAILDAHTSGRSVTTAPNYVNVVSQVGGSNNAIFYLDIHAVAGAIRAALPPDARTTYDADVAPYLNPLRAVGMSEQSSSDHVGISLFLLIQ